jgi:type I restriction enzyme, S subunit
MKQNWEIKKLKEVCEKITDGTHQTPKYFDEGFMFLSSKNVTSGKIDWDNVKYIDEKQHLEMHKRVAPRIGDILLAKNGTTGVAAIVDREIVFDIYVSLAFLRPLKTIYPEYLLKFINSPLAKKQFNKRLKGSGVPNLHLEEIREVEIPLPPLKEQQRIVAILDEAFTDIDKAKTNTEQNLKNAKELFESELQRVFSEKGDGWEEKKLSEIYDVRDGTHDSPKYQENGYPLITSKNLKNDLISFDKISYISEEDFTNINKRSKVDKGDILFAMIGTIGNPVVVIDEPNFAIKNVALFKVPKNQNSFFLKYFLDAKSTIDKMMKDANGTTQKFVGLGYLRSFPILLPTIKDQQTIVSKLDALREQTKKLEAVYEKKLQDLAELKKSVLSKAFSGEL